MPGLQQLAKWSISKSKGSYFEHQLSENLLLLYYFFTISLYYCSDIARCLMMSPCLLEYCVSLLFLFCFMYQMIHGENRLINQYRKYSCSPEAPTSCDYTFSVLCHVAGGGRGGGVVKSSWGKCLFMAGNCKPKCDVFMCIFIFCDSLKYQQRKCHVNFKGCGTDSDFYTAT